MKVVLPCAFSVRMPVLSLVCNYYQDQKGPSVVTLAGVP